MGLDKTRPASGQASSHRRVLWFSLSSAEAGRRNEPLLPKALRRAHITAMLALADGLFIISASENLRD